MTIKEIFDALMVGNSSVVVPANIQYLNDTALELYNTPVLNNEQIETLKEIIMICNVLYNRTDMTVLPVEDGFYDLLLEKYKTYDSNFQVGSAIVEFKNFIENDIDHPRKIAYHPVTFLKQEPKKNVTHQTIFDNIMRYNEPIPIDIRDFTNKGSPPEQVYITKRSHDTEHNHPNLVGTLDKCKFVLNQDAINAGVFSDPNVKILERDFFQDHVQKGIIHSNQELEVVVELKYDGVSVEADCTDEIISARTRGDTGIDKASDITPLLKGYPFPHADLMKNENPVGVKFEAIMTKTDLCRFNRARDRNYSNCRSAMVGLFTASDAYLYRDYITLVPLALDGFPSEIESRMHEIMILNEFYISHGEPLRYCYFKGTIQEILYYIKAFWDEAKVARDYLNFMYDGIVVSYIDKNIRNTLGRKNSINKYSMAVKFDPLEKQTMFKGYTYEVGQHGDITPMIHYDPVEFIGTIHTKSSGASLARFKELALRYGDFINVTYRNDVMPYVSKVDCAHNRDNPNPIIEFPKTCPICDTALVVTDSGKKALCPNVDCPGRSIQRMVNMFAKMNIKGFADATFGVLHKDHLWQLPLMNKAELCTILGNADGENFYNAIQQLMTTPQKDYIIMGSLGFSSMAHKKWQEILAQIRLKDIEDLFIHSKDVFEFRYKLSEVIKTGTATLNTIAEQWTFFAKDIEFVLNNIPLIESYGNLNVGKKQIRFSGIRNEQLAEQLSTLGYDADDNGSVTKKTDILLIPYEGFTSNKTQKASTNPSTLIVPIQDFINNMDKYLQ